MLTFKHSRPPISTAAAFLRRLSAEPQPSPPDTSPQVSEVLSLLQTTDPNSWSDSPNLRSLLRSLAAPSVLRITRHLPNYQHALQFLNHLKSIPQLSCESLSVAFQAVLELAMRESSDCAVKLNELFQLSKDQNIPISVNAATLLIKCFGDAGMLEEMAKVINSIDEGIINTDMLNLVIAGYLKCGRIDDVLKVLDYMFQPDSCYFPNENTVNIVMNSILRRDWCGRNVRDEEIYYLFLKFHEHSIYMNGALLTNIILRFCRNGELDKAWTVLHEAMDAGIDVKMVTYNTLLMGLGRRHDYARMNLCMKNMKEKGVKPSIVTCGIIVKYLCKFRRVDNALEVLERMSDEIGTEPDIMMYNTVIDGFCKVGRQEEGLELMEKMRLVNTLSPNTVTYNCLIDGFCKVGETEKGLELFEQMGKEGLEVNVITVNTLLDSMCKHGRISRAMEFFREMQEKGLKGSTVTYTILIMAFCNANNINKSMKLFDEIQESGLSPDAVVYYSLIAGLSQAGRMDDATQIVFKMKEAGFHLDIIAYNNLIAGFCRKKNLPKVSEMLADMEKSGLKADRVTYNSVVSFLGKNGDFSYTNKVMMKMVKDGIAPDVITYGAVIQGYCQNDKLDEAMKIFNDMNTSLKVPPNTIIYNILINAHCKKHDVEAALSLMNDMNEKGLRPNTITYNALFKGLRERNWFEKALEYMDQMVDQSCNPNYLTMEILTPWLPAVGLTEKLQKFVHKYELNREL